jgi:teichuronic acid exporter
MANSLKKRLLSGLIWSVTGQILFVTIGFIGNALLARFLTPTDFGKMGIVIFFVALGRVLAESGMGGALVRKIDASEDDFSTVFLFNLAVSCIIFILFCAIAQPVSVYYAIPDLQWLIVVSSSALIIEAFMLTQNIRIARELKYRRKSMYDLTAVTISSCVGIVMALLGCGVWSIVGVQLSSALTLASLFLIFEPPMKRSAFSVGSFKQLYAFGVNTTVASIINTAFDNVYQLILGKHFTVGETGLYYQAKKLEQVPVGLIRSTTLGVVYSALSKVQDDIPVFELYYRKVVTIFSIFTGVVCGLVFMYSDGIIQLIYGNGWIGAAPFMRVLAIASFFFMQEMFSRIIFKVFNRTERILALEILKKFIQSVTIVVGLVLMSIEALIYGILITNVLSYFINFYYSRMILGRLDWSEVLIVSKIIVAIGSCIAFTAWFAWQIGLSVETRLLTIPVFVLLYVLLLVISGTFNPIREFREMKRLLAEK